MFRKVTISRSIRTLGTMLASGVPIMDAIRLAGEVVRQLLLRAALGARARRSRPAASASAKSSSGNPLFPRVLVQMIAAGEETGKLDMVLERVSSYYDQEVETVAEGHHQPDRADHDQRDGRGGRHHRPGPDAADLQPQQAAVVVRPAWVPRLTCPNAFPVLLSHEINKHAVLQIHTEARKP